MTTIIIRLKSCIIFGVALLALSLVWLGITGWESYKSVFADNTTPVNEQEEVRGPVVEEPLVTIVPQEEGGSKDNFFTEYRIERERTRSEQIEILREIVSNPNSSAQLRQEAQRKLIGISDNLEKESKIENTLIAKGFRDAIVVIQQEAVMVIIPSNGFRQDEIARIADIVVKIVGCELEDVVIVPKAPPKES